MSTLATVLAVLAGVCLLAAFAIPPLKRAARWVDTTLQNTRRPTTTDQKENTTA